MRSLQNILWLGIKELRSLMSDAVLVGFVVFAFTWTVYSQATGTSNEVNNASIAFADEDGSALSKELFNAFFPPRFQRAVEISPTEVENAMDRGRFMFVVTIPPKSEDHERADRDTVLSCIITLALTRPVLPTVSVTLPWHPISSSTR